MEDDIQIERYETPKVEAYKSSGEHYGTINNEHEFNKFRIQMLEKEVTDKYYFMWGEVKITVDPDGSMSEFPVGLYDQVQRDLGKIMRIVQSRRKK